MGANIHKAKTILAEWKGKNYAFGLDVLGKTGEFAGYFVNRFTGIVIDHIDRTDFLNHPIVIRQRLRDNRHRAIDIIPRPTQHIHEFQIRQRFRIDFQFPVFPRRGGFEFFIAINQRFELFRRR